MTSNFLNKPERSTPFKSPSQVSDIETSDNLMLDMDGQRPQWDEYHEQLYKANPPGKLLLLAELQKVEADPPIDKTPAISMRSVRLL